jgi:hypothetical protein
VARGSPASTGCLSNSAGQRAQSTVVPQEASTRSGQRADRAWACEPSSYKAVHADRRPPRDASVTVPASATTSAIGHGHSRSWRQRSRIGRSWSTVVAPVWNSGSVSIAVAGRYAGTWSISVAVPGFYVRAWSISIAVAGLYVRGRSVSIAVAGLDVRGWPGSITITGFHVRGCSIAIARRYVRETGPAPAPRPLPRKMRMLALL